MKQRMLLLLALFASLSAQGGVPVYYDDFETGYVTGQTFASPANRWQSSSASAYITNNGQDAGSYGAVMEQAVTLTNTVGADTNLQVWTDFRLKPVLGGQPNAAPTNTSSLCYYFNSDGVVMVYTPSGWAACSNDVWGNAVPAVSNDYVRMSVFQNYATATQAVFLNDQLLIQDLPVGGNVAALTNLMIQNTSSNCWLDNVWIKTNVGPSDLVGNRNGDSMYDAAEIRTYGYARRTLYVCQTETNLTPLFGSITNAVAAWRARDLIHVIGSGYGGESVIIANPSNVVFEGDAFVVSNLTVAANASVTFGQTVSCDTLALTGQMAMANGTAVTANTATVVGSLAFNDGNGNLTASNLTVAAGGDVNAQTSAQNLMIAGNTTIAGQIISVTNLVIPSGVTAAFSQSVNCSTLLVTGTMNMAASTALTSTMVHVTGALNVSNNTFFVVNTLDISGAGYADFTSAHLVASAANTSMSGTFRVSGMINGANLESLVVLSGAMNVSGPFSASSLTVATGAAVSFAQSAYCGTLSVSGTVTMATGASLTSSTATVVGSLAVSTNGALVVTNLAVVSSGVVSFTTNAQLVAVTAGVTLSGPLTLSNTWGSASVIAQSLPFGDNFDAYADGTAMSALKYLGWNASDNLVTAQNTARAGRASQIPAGSLLSNSVSSSATKVWSDYYLRPVWGVEPPSPPTNTASFVGYVNTNGYLVVAVAGGWYVCASQILTNAAATPLDSNSFTRVSVCEDLGASLPVMAVFVDGRLVAYGLQPPTNPGRCRGLMVVNLDVKGTAYLDDVNISATIPAGLTGDQDGNGHGDASEIDNYGMPIQFMPSGTIFKIR